MTQPVFRMLRHYPKLIPATVKLGGESVAALAEGLKNALGRSRHMAEAGLPAGKMFVRQRLP